MASVLLTGVDLARGVCRHLTDRGVACLTEFVPQRGLRTDVTGLDKKGEVWVVECKSGLPDYRSDQKWRHYLDWCDRYFWAVTGDFPEDVLPEETGLIRADAYDAEIVREAPLTPLAPARRRALTLRFARVAALRTHGSLEAPADIAGW
ncbi:MAG: MmcB family DNA repair protein [Pseudomonadota bacterium]